MDKLSKNIFQQVKYGKIKLCYVQKIFVRSKWEIIFKMFLISILRLSSVLFLNALFIIITLPTFAIAIVVRSSSPSFAIAFKIVKTYNYCDRQVKRPITTYMETIVKSSILLLQYWKKNWLFLVILPEQLFLFLQYLHDQERAG